MQDTRHIEVAFDNPANAGILRHLQSGRSLSVAGGVAACSPESVQDPYIKLGTHPDLVARLWNGITTALAVRCDWVVHGAPVLVRPDTGIIFAFAGGTHTYALRLPATEREELVAVAKRQAEEHADQFALRDRARERYVERQSGDVHEYADGSTVDISTVGKEWVFGRWLEGETSWCLAAYEHAA